MFLVPSCQYVTHCSKNRIHVSVYVLMVFYSKNSLDENIVSPDDNEPGYDEQEMSVEMQNDEFDQYHRYNNGTQGNRDRDRDKYLRAALEAQKEPIAIKEQNTVKQNSSDYAGSNHLSPSASDNRQKNEKMHLMSNGKTLPPQIPNGVSKTGNGGPNRNGFASIGRHSKLSTSSAADTGRFSHGSEKSHRNISNVGKPSIIGGSLYENKGFDMQATEI